MKAYTDIEQSKKLAEILPLESADMYFDGFGRLPQGYAYTLIFPNSFEYDKPCWSLAALLKVIRETVGYELLCNKTSIIIKCELGDNPWSIEINENNEVDACYEMIIKLHEQNIL